MSGVVEGVDLRQAAPEPAPPARRSPGRKPRNGIQFRWQQKVLTYLVLTPLAILFVAPFAWLISASFQPMGEIFSTSPHWVPNDPTLDGYKGFLDVGQLTKAQQGQGHGDWRWFANSAFVAIMITVLQTFFNALCAYCFAKRRFPGRNVIFMLFLATMMVPGQVTLIPNYLIIKHIPFFGGNDWMGNGGHGWLDSYWGLIMPGIVSAFGIFLIRQYMLSIPDQLLEAARIDGASEFRIFWSVVLPLCAPALAANAIFTFQGAWEDFFWPLIILSSPEKITAPVGLALFVVQNRTSWTLLFAGSVIAALPMIIVFLVFQRKFVQGIALTGVKG
ncbi:carbohydrate ABC transporter membrane protein 2, CUT1 family [Micromonospora viridifaciens]|uniref:Carbohydrate ABC transporter membrane protein 2, CUT1 family n=1 Tax=Micromonospora viridifaciens TaxID=1881 RepID=A0A1C4WKB0_MICVI|nr:carbohydrate ABC transporter permease [Micromonospora viridifaciens]SCE96642.1 carbohydrate ABC transporter membrane protein 2, CUT1 family [Micromonospora viridifaciens]